MLSRSSRDYKGRYNLYLVLLLCNMKLLLPDLLVLRAELDHNCNSIYFGFVCVSIKQFFENIFRIF